MIRQTMDHERSLLVVGELPAAARRGGPSLGLHLIEGMHHFNPPSIMVISYYSD